MNHKLFVYAFRVIFSIISGIAFTQAITETYLELALGYIILSAITMIFAIDTIRLESKYRKKGLIL